MSGLSLDGEATRVHRVKSMPQTVTLYQKGANGLIAEYECAMQLHAFLSRTAQCTPAYQDLNFLRDQEVGKFAKELTAEQIDRAKAQGLALAVYLAKTIDSVPSDLGLPADFSIQKYSCVEIRPTGHLTSKGSSSDLHLSFHSSEKRIELPISLKAYRGTTSSLGSKGAQASLTRMFLGRPNVTEDEFVGFFGEPAREFLQKLSRFKAVSKEFYIHSEEGRLLLQQYRARKENPEAKVNNPLRRKELGDYFFKVEGYKSEHEFARLYVAMFDHGFKRVKDTSNWNPFIEGVKFVLGIENDILTLNAVAGDDGKVTRIINSHTSETHGMLRKVLVPGCEFHLKHKPESSMVGVEIVHDSIRFTALNLAVWKDATIQFKIDSIQ